MKQNNNEIINRNLNFYQTHMKASFFDYLLTKKGFIIFLILLFLFKNSILLMFIAVCSYFFIYNMFIKIEKNEIIKKEDNITLIAKAYFYKIINFLKNLEEKIW